MARPTKLTPELQAAFLQALRRSWYLETAAEVVEIERGTIYKWIRWGRERPGTIFGEFRRAVKKTLAECESEHREAIGNATEWTARAWLLERRFPDRWAGVRKELAEVKRLLAEALKLHAQATGQGKATRSQDDGEGNDQA